MSGYVMPPMPNANMKKALQRQRKPIKNQPQGPLPPGVQERARSIALETNSPLEIVKEAYSRGLIYGLTDDTLRAIIAAKLLHKALDPHFSWQGLNEMVAAAQGDGDLLHKLLASGIKGKEVNLLDIKDANTQDGLDLLGMLP